MGPSDMKIGTRSKLHVTLGVICFFLFLLVLFFNYSTSNQDLGIFDQPIGNMSRRYDTLITPAGWTFSIWAVIYTWMFVALIYALSQLCRHTPAGPVFLAPVTVPIGFWVWFALNQLLNISWLFVWDRQMMSAAAVCLGLIAITNWLCMYCLHVRLWQHGYPVKLHSRRELVLLRVCVHNGLAVYTTWTSVAALLNLCIALTYVGQVSSEIASGVVALLLTAGIVIFFILEVTVLDKYTRWTITPGFTLVWATSGVFSKNFHRAAGPLPALIGVALAAALVTLLLRLISLAVLTKVRPIGGSTSSRVAIASGEHNLAFQQQP